MAEVVEKAVVQKVGDVITSINASKHVDQVISAVYSLAALLFPIDSLSFIGSISENYKDEVRNLKVLSENERNEWWNAFYKGAGFPAFARILLYDVASDWLACFPISARKSVYDVFFMKGHLTEVVQTIVPCLQHRGGHTSYDVNAVYSNAERLLVLCLLQNDGVLQLALEFSLDEELTGQKLRQDVSLVAQLLSSIPDKARPGPSNQLSAHLFFKSIAAQLLTGAEEWDKTLPEGADSLKEIDKKGTILLVGETFARICRRGSADVLLSELIPRLHCQVKIFLSGTADMTVPEASKLKPGFRFWSKLIEGLKDSYAIERMSEQLLQQLAAEDVTDVEAYWILWTFFYPSFKQQKSIRSMFVERFLLWKVFPFCCLRWILHLAVFECSPDSTLGSKHHDSHYLFDTVQRLVLVWSKQEFVQSTKLEQQTYVTAALGLCLEKMSKEDLDATKDAIHSILQGVSCKKITLLSYVMFLSIFSDTNFLFDNLPGRLESPDHLIRKMASSIALVFSKVIDPQNPLYLDDSCHDEDIDWGFGLVKPDKRLEGRPDYQEKGENQINSSAVVPAKVPKGKEDFGAGHNVESTKKKTSEYKLVDPDEVIDPAGLNGEMTSDAEQDDLASEDSDTSSDSSLQPYDLTDDNTDLKRRFSQLADVVGALRKSDDIDGVEGALDVAEKLVRASPDELKYVASDMVRTLIQVRCSDLAAEGEEESAEEKRQKTLIALIVTCPLESLEALQKLLYSPTVDVSQRIMILDVMTEAAQELASTRILKPEHKPRELITSASEQAWFIPRSIGPPGASSWKEVARVGTPLNWSYSYERTLPLKHAEVRRGKTRRWSTRSASKGNQPEWSQNGFPQYAAAFMLPAMQGFDKKRHGVDLLGRDFLVLGKLIYMLGVCIKCAAMHPEASVLASPLLDMLSIREISHHSEAFVRRSALFAASCILVALHPSYVASALATGNDDIPKGLEWIRTWAHQIAEEDSDRDCYELAMTCLQLHSEMALQASRALESSDSNLGGESFVLPSPLTKGTIKLPHRIIEL
ncbi:OLC1v1013528C1 [Oldenlandia corymbosa var. corymbosa]|uniref:OLC1v1013528C1 n=1 Tax=Oldenlandia corymbosa var. corymbosa TaxID=529605 RepID=A0AAV1E244_OLDCO|nr:OLC1v1013528C1 [Oldenlandia corymbosa var. corymbosa]